MHTIPFYSPTTPLKKDGKEKKEDYKELFHVSRLFQLLYTISSAIVTWIFHTVPADKNKMMFLLPSQHCAAPCPPSHRMIRVLE